MTAESNSPRYPLPSLLYARFFFFCAICDVSSLYHSCPLDNKLIGQQLKTLKEKKTGIIAAKPKKQLDEAQRKELYELQEQTGSYIRDLRQVTHRLNALSRERAATDNTQKQIQEFPAETALFRGIGKAYIQQDRAVIDGALAGEIAILAKNREDLVDREKYLERRIQDNQSSIRDLAAGL